MNKKWKFFGVFAVCSMIFGGILFENDVQAAMSSQAESVLKKNYANSLNICYQGGALAKKITVNRNEYAAITDNDFIDNKILLNGSGGTWSDILYYKAMGETVSVQCADFLTLDNSNSVFSIFGKKVPEKTKEAGDFLNNMGYSLAEGSTTQTIKGFCLVIRTIGKLCWNDENQSVYTGPNKNELNDGYSYTYNNNWDNEEPPEIVINKGTGFVCRIPMSGSFIKDFGGANCDGNSVTTALEQESYEVGGDYRIADTNDAYATARNWLAGSEKMEALTNQDIYDLYAAYLNDVGVVVNTDNCSAEKPGSGQALYALMDDKETFKWCIVETARVGNGAKFPGVTVNDAGEYYYLDKSMNIDELLAALSEWNRLHPEAAIAAAKNAEKGDDKDNKPKDLCYNSAGAMGWVLCPAVVATSGIGQTMWDEVKKNLQFDASVLNSGDNVEQGWMAIRDIANTVFIILFLVVIFSQLTGVGIDNYGIKKILPKLIIIAILINLSFILCRVFVDVSNIAGVGLENLFKSIAPEMPKEAAGATDGMLVGGATGLILAGIGIGAIFIHLQGMNGGKELLGAAAIGILGAIIVVLIGILTIFLILAIRKAGIVLLTVLSPLAIVCYALPNTEKISKKWLDAFKALLIVYPICGAMVGAGEFAKVVLYNVDPLLSMMASVVPYFFVPVLLKNSLNAIGNIGGKLSAFGRGLGKRGSGAATGAIRNSEKYKDWAAHQKEMREQYRARRIYNGLQGKTSRKAKARATKMAGILAAGAAKEYADERGAQASSLEAMEIAAAKKSKEMEVENQMALVNNKTRNGEDEELLNAEFDEAVASGNKAKAIAIARIAGRRADTARAFVSKKFSDNAAMESNPELFRDIAKEITTGVNSANYRQSSPFDFEYASLLNRNGFSKPVVDENGKPVVDGKGKPVDAGANTFSSWKQSQNNTSAALDHHVAKAPDLMAMKTSALDDIIQMRKDGHISDEEFTRIQGMARDLIQMHEEHRDNGTFDTTKAKQIEQIAAGIASNSGPRNIQHQ